MPLQRHGDVLPVAMSLKIIVLSRPIRLWVGVALLVALASACSGPNIPGTESALAARLVSGGALGPGWAPSRAPRFTRDEVLIPCQGHCVAPRPRGNGIRETFNSGEASFVESIAWTAQARTFFESLEQATHDHSPGVSPAPRIASGTEFGQEFIESTHPTVYLFNYWVEADEYVGNIQRSDCRLGEVRAAFRQFASGS
jgi:hypothetical protein